MSFNCQFLVAMKKYNCSQEEVNNMIRGQVEKTIQEVIVNIAFFSMI